MTRWSLRHYAHRGYTILELVIVLAIVALMATSVQVILNGPLRVARMRHTINVLAATDATLRHECRKKAREGSMEFDCKTGTMTVQLENGQGPKFFRISGLNSVRTAQGERLTWKTRVDRWGRSETYAIEIGRSPRNKWVLFAGVTGQMMEEQNETDIEAILDQLTPSNLAN
jgi:prepilin-type N-terminal cleavage/methylation domain-containing protein